MFAIVISEKGGAERREVFERPDISVGRVQGNDLMLPKGNVSKRHARLVYRDDRFIVTDLNSTNGTYVNRRRITQATIVREGDRIYIGDFVLRLEPPGGSGAVERPGDDERPSQPAAAEPDEPTAGRSSPLALPQVPGPPRVPSGARVQLVTDAAASDAPAASPVRAPAPEPSRPSMPAPRRPTASSPDSEALAHRNALRALVERAEGALDPGELDGDVVGFASRVSQLVTEHSNRLRAEGRLGGGVNLEQLLSDARTELVGTGPFEALLREAEVTEIVISRFDDVIAVRNGEETRVEPPFTSEAALQRAVRRLCEQVGVPLQSGERVVERRLPDGGVLSAALAPASVRGTVVVVRKLREVRAMLDDLVRSGMASSAMASFLEQCVAANVNLLVTGPRDPGTLRVVSALCAAAAGAHHIVIQRFSDLVPADDATLFSVTGRQSDAGRLLDLAAQVPGARLVVELAAPELTEALVASVASGVEGVIGVAYAATLRRALARLPADLMASRPGLGPDAAREWAAATFEIVVEVGRLADGRPRILRVCEVTGTGGGGIATQEVFAFTIDHASSGGGVQGTFAPSGTIPRVVADLQTRGLTVDTSLFSRPR